MQSLCPSSNLTTGMLFYCYQTSEERHLQLDEVEGNEHIIREETAKSASGLCAIKIGMTCGVFL